MSGVSEFVGVDMCCWRMREAMEGGREGRRW